MTRPILRAAALSILAALCACAPLTPFAAGAKPPTSPSPLPPATFRVGTARVDLTPPPGAATFGHGPDAHLGEGYWTRIQCRVFFFETDDAPARPMALVPCELQSTSHYLQRTVAEKVKDLVSGARIFLSSTHTHAGPAHYWEGDAYGGPTSSRYPGFDPVMVEFLATRIADGIRVAHGGMRPAKLRLLHDDVWDVSRNRSIDAYRLNAHPWLGAAPDPSAPLEHRAIDPALDVLEIAPVDGEYRPNGPMGAVVFFAMHPTVLSAQNHLFGGDVYGITSRTVERELRRAMVAGQPQCADPARLDDCLRPIADPLVAVVNGSEGDLVPRYEDTTLGEAIRVGATIGDRVVGALSRAGATGFRDRVAIDARFLELDLRRDTVGGKKLCDPVLGQAATRGGSDHRASIELLTKDSSDSDVTAGCDAPKHKGLGALQDLIAGPSAFPRYVPIGLVRFDQALFAFAPAELTLTAGHDVDDAIAAEWTARAGAPSLVRVAGLTNGYIQYVATRDEYQMQAYEGASTLYGPATLDLLVDRFRGLARDLAGAPAAISAPIYAIDEVPAITLDTATHRPRFARAAYNVSLHDLDAKGKRRVRAFCRLPGRDPAALCLEWSDGGPGVVPLTAAPWVALVRNDGRPARTCGAPLGTQSLGFGCDPRATLDDWGMELVVRTRGETCERDGAWTWVAVLSPRASDWADLAREGALRVHVDGASALSIDSPTFTVGPGTAAAPPPVCDAVTMRACLGEAPIECTR